MKDIVLDAGIVSSVDQLCQSVLSTGGPTLPRLVTGMLHESDCSRCGNRAFSGSTPPVCAKDSLLLIPTLIIATHTHTYTRTHTHVYREDMSTSKHLTYRALFGFRSIQYLAPCTTVGGKDSHAVTDPHTISLTRMA